MASSISKISTAHNRVYMPTVTPHQAFEEFASENESFGVCINNDVKKMSKKQKRGNSTLSEDANTLSVVDEHGLRKKLSDHFTVVCDVVENEKLRREPDCTTLSLQLHGGYKRVAKMKKGSKVDTPERKINRSNDVFFHQNFAKE